MDASWTECGAVVGAERARVVESDHDAAAPVDEPARARLPPLRLVCGGGLVAQQHHLRVEPQLEVLARLWDMSRTCHGRVLDSSRSLPACGEAPGAAQRAGSGQGDRAREETGRGEGGREGGRGREAGSGEGGRQGAGEKERDGGGDVEGRGREGGSQTARGSLAWQSSEKNLSPSSSSACSHSAP